MNQETRDTFVKLFVIATFFVFAIAMVGFNTYVKEYKTSTYKYFINNETIISDEIGDLLKKQEKIDNKLQKLAKNGSYSIDSPYILINPYGTSPLSAVIVFNTRESVSAFVDVNNNYSFNTDKTNFHIIPIYGLYANVNNFVKISLSNGTEKTLNLSTDALNDKEEEFSKLRFSDKQKFILTTGDKNSLRAFDKYQNLLFYTKFRNGNIISFDIENDKILLNYKDVNGNIVRIVMDYIGRIVELSDDVVSNNDKLDVNIYKNVYTKINFDDFSDNRVDEKQYSMKKYKVYKIEKQLDNTNEFKSEGKISLIGDYIYYNFNLKKVHLLLVGSESGRVYDYQLHESGKVKIDVKENVALFLLFDDNYYRLNKVIKVD